VGFFPGAGPQELRQPILPNLLTLPKDIPLHLKNPTAATLRSSSSAGSSSFSSAFLAGFLLLSGGLLLTGCSDTQAAKSLRVTGAVHGGQQAVAGSTIQLYAAGTTGDGSAATPLLSSTVTTSDGSGNATNSNANAGNNFNALPAGSFTITGAYTCPSGSTQVYLVSTGGNPGLAPGTNNPSLALMAALGSCSNLTSATFIFVNELTTVGSLAALNNFTTSYSSIGSGSSDASALQSAFNLANEYTNTSLGSAPGPLLPSSSYASSIELQTLANALSVCVNSDGTSCSTLFTNATPSGKPAPTDTIGAALNIINNPALNVCSIYALVPSSPPFQPTLSSCPSSWIFPISPLAVTVTGPSTVALGQNSQYAAAVSATGRGATNQSVIWSVNGVAGGNSTTGTISATGLYTPPSIAPGAITISAVSTLSSSASGSLSATVVPISVAVTGPANVLFSQPGQYSAVATGTSNQNFTWRVNGVAGGSSAQGTITAGGLYTAPATAPTTPVVVTAQSTDPSQPTGSLSVTISAATATYATGDSRTVTQPVYPGVCAVLSAQFNTSQRSSPPAAGSDDTTIIQTALNSAPCKNTGLAVELTASGTNTAFYSEQLTLNGEGLIIDAGVTLYGGASYNTVSGPLISINGANSSLMGPGTVDGRGDILSNAKSNRLVQTNSANNFIAYNVTLTQSIYPNLYIQGGNGATVWGVTILTPATRANADGIDLDSLTNATVINSTIEAGDDGVAVKPNNANASNVTVTNNRLYGTHGLSIGSVPKLAVSNILFLNNYIYGSDLSNTLSPSSNGLVIKQDPTCATTVSQVTYQNTCITGVKHLITFYTNYSGTCSGTAGTPVFNNIMVNGVLATQSISGAYEEFIGWSAAAPSSAALANVSLDVNALNTGANASQYTAISLYNSSLTNAILTGPGTTGMTTNTFSTPGSVPTCSF
jgi:polygalacturonase